MSRDIDFEKLPQAARDKLLTLQQRREDDYSLLQGATSKVEECAHLVADARRLLGALQGHVGMVGVTAEELAKAEERLRLAREKQEKAAAVRKARSERWHQQANLLNRVKDWITGLPAGISIEPHDAPITAPRRGETALKAVERVRATLRTLESELDIVRHAPLPSALAKRQVRSMVSALAESGRPNLLQLIEARRPQIRWPMASVTINTQGSTTRTGEPVLGSAMGPIFDPLAFAAWLNPDALIAGLEREIDRQADDSSALDDEACATRIQELQLQILDAERQEEDFISIAIDEGADVVRRLTADPRAVLGLSGDLPGVRE